MRAIFLTNILFLVPALWAQPTTPSATPSKPATPGTAPKPATPGQPGTPTSPANNGNADNKDKGAAQIAGFDGIAWGVTYKEMKDKFRVMASNANAADNVEIISDNPDREILIRRREIYYRYVFYKKPPQKSVESMPKPDAAKATAEKPAEVDATAGTAKFFFVESIFPLLKSEELYAKLSEKYGQRTGSSVGETPRGAYSWEKDEGFLVQWVEPYAKQGYTRSLYYLSRKIRDEIKSDLQAWQFVREIKAIESLLK
jgi:hypothetical protein